MGACAKVEQLLGLMLAPACCVTLSALAQPPSWMPQGTSHGKPLHPLVRPHCGVYSSGVSALAFNCGRTLLAVSTRNGAIAASDGRSGD